MDLLQEKDMWGDPQDASGDTCKQCASFMGVKNLILLNKVQSQQHTPLVQQSWRLPTLCSRKWLKSVEFALISKQMAKMC